MILRDMAAMNAVDFFWKKRDGADCISPTSPDSHQFSAEVLNRNIAWYISLRWVSCSILLLYYCISFLPSAVIHFIGVVSEGTWSLYLACFLLFANGIFYVVSRRKSLSGFVGPHAQMWAQIVIDISCIAVVVHFGGSVATPAPFLYILHIALACIFFPIHLSLSVTFISSVLYGACVFFEYIGFIRPHAVFAARAMGPLGYFANGSYLAWHVFSVTTLFFLLWYMVSRLTKVIRIREKQLVAAGEETRNLQLEKDRYSAQMTHQLKAPLDAIRSNISLVLYFNGEKIPVEVVALLQKIDARARGLAALILDVLKLSRLNTPLVPPEPVNIAFDEIVERCVDELTALARQRKITIETSIEKTQTYAVADQIHMMVENIISNAIVYSNENGVVFVRCDYDTQIDAPVFRVADRGIGIPAEKVPHIFEDYFHTKESVCHNSASTGIGLAIVKKVAETHGIRLKVESELGQGTIVTAVLPKSRLET